MGRAARQDLKGAWHHVMNRGADRGRIFFTRNDGLAFEHLLADATTVLGVELHAYCLMPNHFHLLLHCPHGGLSKYMQRVGANYSRRINARLDGEGSIFRSRFHSRLLDSPTYLAQAGRYIHRNPLELSPPVDPTSYRWSSLRYYAGLDVPPPWLHTSTLRDICSGDYLDYVAA